ncbi:PREDICTED: rho guanine nucleotide exchange factor 11-like, partial [Ficedula albicollis]|uniref:rho guanine nucleotide exchange factor 11-like n=1 Tax=Ficedula albicollis TaxID=59894 RepID=UPI0007AD85D2
MDSQDGEPGLESTEVSGRPQIIGPEEDCEPGYASNESDSVFQDLARLKSRPAHLAVFLRFLLSQADPTPLLFHLCSEVCCQLSSPKESRALARDIWSIFLDRGAVRGQIWEFQGIWGDMKELGRKFLGFLGSYGILGGILRGLL